MSLPSSPQNQSETPGSNEEMEAVLEFSFFLNRSVVEGMRNGLIRSIGMFQSVARMSLGSDNLLVASQLKTVMDEIKAVREMGVDVDDIQLSFDREVIPILERDIPKALRLLGVAITEKSKEIPSRLSIAEDLIRIAENTKKRQLRAGIKTVIGAMMARTKQKGGIKDVKSAKKMESKIVGFKKTLKEYQAAAVKVEAELHKEMVAEIVDRVRTAKEAGVDLSPVLKELGVKPPNSPQSKPPSESLVS